MLLLVSAFIIAAAGAVGVVWLKQQSSMTAHETKMLERKLSVLARDNAELTARVARLHTPNYLLARMRGMQLDLVPPSSGQLVWVNEERGAGDTYAGREVAMRDRNLSPFVLTLDAALTTERARERAIE